MGNKKANGVIHSIIPDIFIQIISIAPLQVQSGPQEPRAHRVPKNEELGGKLNPKSTYRDHQSSKIEHNQLSIVVDDCLVLSAAGEVISSNVTCT